MYNLTVATAHTFYVGDGQWLVHNEGDSSTPKRAIPKPPGMTNAEAGKLIGWGTGQDGTAKSLERMKALTEAELHEMFQKGITPEIAEQMAEFYASEAKRNPANPSASGRATLMQSIAERMKALGLGGC